METSWARDGLLRISGLFTELATGEGVGRITAAATLLGEAIRHGSTVYWCGNGGSAGDAQHLATELIGRFGREGRGYPSIALTTDTSLLTAVANDFGYERVFERQIEALVRPGDVVIGISTSGRSPNVIRALGAAQRLGAHTIAFTGPAPSDLEAHADVVVRAPGNRATEIQTCHIAIGQLMVEHAIVLAEGTE